MKGFWKDKKVLVTGGTGFVGSFVCKLLLKKGAVVSVTTNSKNTQKIKEFQKSIKIINANLEIPNDALRATRHQDVILNLASKVAGIQFNMQNPATMFTHNVQISQNVIDSCLKNNVKRVLMVSSACVYPRECTIPTPEKEGFLNDPEPTNLGYGWSKRVAELLARFYHEQYGLKVAIARPYNAYGPKDNFDPKTSHVIPGIIKRVMDGENPLIVWGSGNQTRSFLYVEDLAEGLLLCTEKMITPDPVNLGTKEEITISKLASKIVKYSNMNTKIIFDKSKPDGQPRRNCNTRKALVKIGFTAKTNLDIGLFKTIEWYKNNEFYK